jgi:hypothetical protein
VKVKPTTKVTKWKTIKSKFSKRRNDVGINQTTDLPHNERNESCLIQFDTINNFQVLVDIPDENEWIGNCSHKTEIMKIPKQRLEKCRFCNFKKKVMSIFILKIASQGRKFVGAVRNQDISRSHCAVRKEGQPIRESYQS